MQVKLLDINRTVLAEANATVVKRTALSIRVSFFYQGREYQMSFGRKSGMRWGWDYRLPEWHLVLEPE